MIGAKDLALPKINLLSWYLYMAGGILAIYTMATGGVDTGWTFTTPLVHALCQHQRADHGPGGLLPASAPSSPG
jgi:cytochrome c oxidase subunit 1